MCWTDEESSGGLSGPFQRPSDKCTFCLLSTWTQGRFERTFSVSRDSITGAGSTAQEAFRNPVELEATILTQQ